jgi:hypothetical protein
MPRTVGLLAPTGESSRHDVPATTSAVAADKAHRRVVRFIDTALILPAVWAA